MKSQRSAITLGVMVAALLVWLLVRSRIPAPAPPHTAENVSSARSGPTTGNIPATRTPAPDAPSTRSVTPEPSATPPAQTPPVPTQKASPSVTPSESVSTTATAPASSESASINAIKVRRMITDYHTLTGENPVGTNAEIMAAMMGKNVRQATVGPPEGTTLNAKGELVDDWGTPYFFHQLSKDVMEIHSAGPDRIMGTADDVIVR